MLPRILLRSCYSCFVVNQEIQDHQEKIRITKYETEALQGNLQTVNHKLIQEQIEEKWLGMRENILKEQKEKSLQEKLQLIQEVVSSLKVILKLAHFKTTSIFNRRIEKTPFTISCY